MGFSRQEYWSGVPLPSPKQHSLAAYKTVKHSPSQLGKLWVTFPLILHLWFLKLYFHSKSIHNRLHQYLFLIPNSFSKQVHPSFPFSGFPGDTSGKEPTCQCRRGKRCGSGRSPGGGNDCPLQYSWLENPMDRGAWEATVLGSQSQTWLSD